MRPDRAKAIEALERVMNGAGARAVTELMTEDIVADWSESTAPYAGVLRGREGVMRLESQFADVWSERSWERGALESAGADRVLFSTHIRMSGAGSGVPIEARGALLVTFRDARICAVKLFQSVGDGRAATRRERLAEARLYFVCEGRPGDGDPAPLLEAALRGGVDVIQLREKAPRCAEEVIALAEPFRRAADDHDALFFLNDHPELVEAAGADGVHVGQDDAEVAEARSLAGAGALVGLSTHSPEQFDAALATEGIARPDQLSVGPVWETPTKPGRPAAGLPSITYAAARFAEGRIYTPPGTKSGLRVTDVPWFAIGGIDAGTVGEVVAAGAERIVVARAIRDAADPEEAARRLRAALAAKVSA